MTGHINKLGNSEMFAPIKLKPNDVADVEVLYEQVISNLHGHEKNYIVLPHPASLATAASGGGMLLGIRDNQTHNLVGCAVIGYPSPEMPRTGLAVQPKENMADYSVLRGILVHPQYRRQGIGNLLLKEWQILSHQVGRSRLYTEVVKGNGASLKMMLNNGFTIVLEAIHPFDQAEVFLLTKKASRPGEGSLRRNFLTNTSNIRR